MGFYVVQPSRDGYDRESKLYFSFKLNKTSCIWLDINQTL